MSLIFILIGAIALGLFTTYIAGFVIKGKEQKYSSTFVFGGSYIASSVYTGILWIIMWSLGYIHFPVSKVFWTSLAITVILNILFNLFRYRAYALVDVAQIAPFAGISPILTIATTWFILGEVPSTGGVFGIIVIAVSLYLLHLKGSLKISTILSPFKSIWNNKGVRYGFISSLPPALSIVFDKKAVAASDPISFAFFAIFFVGLGALITDLIHKKSYKKFINQFSKNNIVGLFKISFFLFIAVILFNAALLFDVVPHVSAMRRIVIVFEVIMAYFILKQKTDLKRRLIASVGVVIGVLMIALL